MSDMAACAAFIRDRLAGEQAAAKQGAGGRHEHLDRDNYGFLWADPARVLAQVAAMRAIVDLHRPEENVDREGMIQCDHCARLCHSESGLMCEQPQDAPFPCPTVRHLAAIWADHEAYDPAWAPDA